MGHFDFRPMRVHQAVTQLLRTERLQTPPVWHDVVGIVTPSTILVRTQPVQHPLPGRRLKKAKRKPSRLFQPLPIVYEEDRLRKTFFQDHPWELARPRMVLESDGKDSQRMKYEQLRQPYKPLDGESVVQRQLYLMNHDGLSKEAAYDKARKEFYNLRLQEDVERMVGREEAENVGAYFGMTNLEIGMQLEDQQYDKWKEDSYKAMEAQRLRSGALAGDSPVLAAADEEAVARTPEEPLDESEDTAPEGNEDN